MAGSDNKAIRNIVVAGILLFLFVAVGVAFRFLIYPMLQGDLVQATGTESRYDHEVTLLADSFSGYAPLRSDGFHAELKANGIKVDVQDDGGNLDPDLYADRTHSSGANYEGQ